MVESEKNARRSDEAERSRHLSATESVAFATMLLGLLNDSDTVLHRIEHEGEAWAIPAAQQAHPSEPVSAPAPADAGPSHEAQHDGTTDAAAAETVSIIHADAAAPTSSQDASVVVDDALSARAITTQVLTSSTGESSVASIDHVTSASGSGAFGGTPAAFLDFGTAAHTITDTVTGIVDTALAVVSSTVASVSATVTQLTSTVTDTISHLADGLLGTITGTSHDATSSGVIEPLVTGLLGPAPSSMDTASHDVPLLDTAGAIPTSLLHPMPLQLGFLGQPTMDGHEPHDGAFQALGVHHF